MRLTLAQPMGRFVACYDGGLMPLAVTTFYMFSYVFSYALLRRSVGRALTVDQRLE